MHSHGLDPARLPRHIGVIMDGNGRWAKSRLMERFRGHEAGVEAVRDTVTACRELGVSALSLYAFSTENWARPKREVTVLMRLLRRFLVEERPTIMDHGIRLAVSGEIEQLPPAVRKEAKKLIADSAGNRGMTLNLCLSYGGQRELTRAAQRLAEKVKAGVLEPAQIDESALARELYIPDLPPMDLMIRTSGEQRVSNFMLWQLAYAEFVFLAPLWPDFRRSHLYEAIRIFQQRRRRFGDVS